MKADIGLRVTAKLWFALALTGQAIFALYVAAFYGRAAIRSGYAEWNTVMPHGYVADDAFGNGVVAAHLLGAFIVAVSGGLQLIPAIRKVAPVFHRWNGRFFLTAAVAAASAGLYMVWVRGSVGDLSQHLGITLDGILVIVFAALALRHAVRREIAVHRRWALRLYLAANGVWFFRIGLMFWLMLNQRPAGFDPVSFTGPTLTFLSFADYLIPLAILELYLRAQERGGPWGKGMMAAGFILFCAVTGIGIFAATLGMWLPRITG